MDSESAGTNKGKNGSLFDVMNNVSQTSSFVRIKEHSEKRNTVRPCDYEGRFVHSFASIQIGQFHRFRLLSCSTCSVLMSKDISLRGHFHG